MVVYTCGNTGNSDSNSISDHNKTLYWGDKKYIFYRILSGGWVEIFYLEYYVYHLAKIFSAVMGGILIYTLIMKFGKEIQYFLLGKTYTQFEMLDNVIDIPGKSILLFVNITDPEQVLSGIGERCNHTVCLCIIKFEEIEHPKDSDYTLADFKTKYVVEGKPYVIKVNLTNIDWYIYDNSYPQFFFTRNKNYNMDSKIYEMINLNSKIFCRRISKRFYLNTTEHKALAAIINADEKPLKIFVHFEESGKIDDIPKYQMIIHEVYRE